MLPPQQLPGDINAELLLAYYPLGTVKLSMQGMHKRNTYGDVIDLEPMGPEALHLTVGRNSLYNSLPEYMFHPVDRFDNLPQYQEKEKFQEQLEEQKQEIADGFRFFAPIDLFILYLRTQLRNKLDAFTHDDVVMQQILGDRLTTQQKQNRFIRHIIPFLPQAKNIRGNRTLLTLILRKTFMEEGLTIRVKQVDKMHTDPVPRYGESLDMVLDDSYVGNTYPEPIQTYEIHYWSDKEAGEHFLHFVDEVEELRQMLQDYFISVEQELHFDITDDTAPLRLNDATTPQRATVPPSPQADPQNSYNFLNYNTNI